MEQQSWNSWSSMAAFAAKPTSEADAWQQCVDNVNGPARKGE
jgi:hypothetical protein